ncbi:Hypothetical protein I5071_73310 [Sandaracinus amylolyticus]|nr:Hypothetical protein I5071_73310 [Sandaracinus amylolyticus]
MRRVVRSGAASTPCRIADSDWIDESDARRDASRSALAVALLATLAAGCESCAADPAGTTRDAAPVVDAEPPASCTDAYRELHGMIVAAAETHGACSADSDCQLVMPTVRCPSSTGVFEYCSIAVSDPARFDDAVRALGALEWCDECAIYADFMCDGSSPGCIDSREVYPSGCVSAEARCVSGTCTAVEAILSCDDVQARWHGVFDELARDFAACSDDGDCVVASAFTSNCGPGVELDDICASVAREHQDVASRRIDETLADFCGHAIAGPCSRTEVAECDPPRCVEGSCRSRAASP